MLVKRENFKYIPMQEYLFTHKKLQWNIEQKDLKTHKVQQAKYSTFVEKYFV